MIEFTPEQKLLEAMMSEMLEIEDEIAMLEAMKNTVRKNITDVLMKSEVKSIEVPGSGTVMITKDTKTVSYDTKGLDSLVAQLMRDGEVHTAHAISALREEKERKGHLMIRRKK